MAAVRDVLVVIPARSGSRGLRHKNLRKLQGKPLLAYAIEAALKAREKSTKQRWQVVVSTDSSHYARVARRYGAETPFLRPPHLSDDRARLIDVVDHAIRHSRLTTATRPGKQREDAAVMMLSACTPLTRPGDLTRALRMFCRHQGQHAVVSVCPDPSQQSRQLLCDADKTLSFAEGGQRLIGPRQGEADPRRCLLSGALHIATPAWLSRHRQFMVEGCTLALDIPVERSVDIETILDLRWASLLLDRAIRH